MAKRGFSTHPIPIKSSEDSRNYEISMMDALMANLRYTTHPWIGYSNRSNAFIKTTKGVTTPKALTDWLSQLGLTDIEESTLIVGKTLMCCGKAGEVSKITQRMFSIYSNKHKPLRELQDLTSLSRKLSNGSKAIILLNTNYVEDIMVEDIMKESKISESETDFTMGFEISHCVYLKSLHVNEAQKKISISFSTYGKTIERDLNLDEFCHNYRGSIVGKFKEQRPKIRPD